MMRSGVALPETRGEGSGVDKGVRAGRGVGKEGWLKPLKRDSDDSDTVITRA